MARLFKDDEATAEATEAHEVSAGERVVGVAVAANVWDSYDYAWPDTLGEPFVGQRVHVSFGRSSKRKTLGFVVDTLRRHGSRKLKSVKEVIDTEAQLDESLWALAKWISQYYLTPLGMTLAAMVPRSVGRRPPRSEAVVTLEADRADWPTSLGPRQRRILDELYEARKQGIEPLPLATLLTHSGAKRPSLNSLVSKDMVRIDHREVRLEELSDEIAADPFDLNAEQIQAVADMQPKLAGGAGFSATLLHGVTGSGKTEVYIRAIREIVAAGRQAILLVPEIGLATQTIQRLLKRLPRVAVLHSALTESKRAFYYQQIRDGHAAVVVGPRSAVFAPARKLGLIIVDEEHEGSYKQDTAPRYHGRDVAVMRAKLAGVPVLLGSATPSLETFHNARTGRYAKGELPHRVRGLPMPALEIVHLRQDITPGRIELIGRTLTARMAAALDRDEQIILLMNRRGYASYVFCPKCKWEMTCENCTRAMVFHQATRMVLCHHCQRSEDLPEQCPACGGKLLLFGMGIQRIEAELARKFPAVGFARMDSDTMTSPAQFKKVFEDFRDGELSILLGTQMVAKGLDFPRVSLVGVVSADTALAIPDFRAAERTFQLIVQVAGRAGRSDTPGRVVVQTVHPDEPAIRHAVRHDYAGFAALELGSRREAGFPPFARMLRFIIRHDDVSKAQVGAVELGKQLKQILPLDQVVMYGPQPAGVARLRGKFRFEILLLTGEAGLVQRLLAPRLAPIARTASPAEIIADVDPVNLM